MTITQETIEEWRGDATKASSLFLTQDAADELCCILDMAERQLSTEQEKGALAYEVVSEPGESAVLGVKYQQPTTPQALDLPALKKWALTEAQNGNVILRLIEELEKGECPPTCPWCEPTTPQAEPELMSLEECACHTLTERDAEIARLREALEKIADCEPRNTQSRQQAFTARKALQGEGT